MNKFIRLNDTTGSAAIYPEGDHRIDVLFDNMKDPVMFTYKNKDLRDMDYEYVLRYLLNAMQL